MTQPQRKIVGKFTENFEYTVNGEPLSHPVWAPRKPNERWIITPNADFTAANANHICALPELFLNFMYSMMKLAERPIHQFPNNAIKFY